LRVDADVIECLNEISQSGILSPSEVQAASTYDCPDEIILPDDLPLEDIWRMAYSNQ